MSVLPHILTFCYSFPVTESICNGLSNMAMPNAPKMPYYGILGAFGSKIGHVKHLATLVLYKH